ncbi:hypothetical protein C7S13_7259 [Burkholderia cepacia]|nr:hypothetical protein [Burkholderia cepacia]
MMARARRDSNEIDWKRRKFNMNRCWITLLSVMVFSTAACSKTSGDAEKESLAPATRASGMTRITTS